MARCLESVKGADAIYICDTGSTDRTVEIARQYTENVYLDFIWCDDFSLAQNHVKSKVKESWILSIDADEVCQDFNEVRRAVAMARAKTLTIRCTMEAEGDTKNNFGFSRLFRNVPEVFWEQPIHKHLNIPGEGEVIGDVRITYGYSPAHEGDPDRALRVLEKTVAEEKNPTRNLYYLGREYWYKGRFGDAILTFKRYIKVAHWDAELADAYLIMAQSYLAVQLIEESAEAVLQAIKINPNFKEAVEFMAYLSSDENAPQWRRMAKSANNQNTVWQRTTVEPPPDVFWIAPHNDDEALFGAYTLIRHKPIVIVVTDSFIQPERGDVGCDAETRRRETIEAMKIAGCPVFFLGIRDTELTEEVLRERLIGLRPEKVYAPAIQGGNHQHDLVGKVCKDLFGERCVQYTTYTKTELYTTGKTAITPTAAEKGIKGKMLACYQSQLYNPATRPHFEAVIDKPEWLD